MIYTRLLLALILGSFFFAGVAIAQTTQPDTTVGLGPTWNVVRPYIQDLLSLLAFAAIGAVSKVVYSLTRINIEAKNREALHSAVMTGVTSALNFVGQKADGITIDVRNRIIADAIKYVQSSVPDALQALNVTPEKLVELASSKIELLAEAKKSVEVVPVPVAVPAPATGS